MWIAGKIDVRYDFNVSVARLELHGSSARQGSVTLALPPCPHTS